MRFVKGLAVGLAGELVAIFGVVPLLHRPVWLLWSILFLLTLPGLLPYPWSLPVQAVLAVLLGLLAIFSGKVAAFIRRRGWVEFPNGPEVVPHLHQLLPLLILPPYFTAMMVLFWRASQPSAGVLPAGGWSDAAALAVDNLVRTQVFFDFFEAFRIRFGSAPAGLVGHTLIFVTRFLLDIAFIKLAVQIGNAAYHRACGLGRGEDKLFLLKGALDAKDAAAVKYLSQSVGDSLRDAVDSLLPIIRGGGVQAARAWRCLQAMRPFALPYLEHRLMAGSPDGNLALVVERLRGEAGDTAFATIPVSSSRWLLLPVAALLLGCGIAPLMCGPGLLGLIVGVVSVAVLGWLLVCSRSSVRRLAAWGAIRPLSPDRVPLAALGWACTVLLMLVVASTGLLVALAEIVPGSFQTSAEQVNAPSAAAYVLVNLLRTQVFFDVANIFHLAVTPLQPGTSIGLLYAFIIRTLFNLGVISLLVSFAGVWWNRLVNGFAVSQHAELALRQEASSCGPHADLAVAYHYRELSDFIVHCMSEHSSEPDLLISLAPSGFFEYYRQSHSAPSPAETASWNVVLGERLREEKRAGEAVAAAQAAIGIYEQLIRDGQTGLRYQLAYARNNLGNALGDQEQFAESLAEYRKALELHDLLAHEKQEVWWEEVGRTHSCLGYAQWRLNCRNEAAAEYRKAIEIYSKLIDEGKPGNRLVLAMTRHNFAITLDELALRDQAASEFRASLEEYETLVKEGHSGLRKHVALLRHDLGHVLSKQGREEEAAREFRQAVAVWDRLIREGRTDLEGDRAWTLTNLAACLSKGHQEEAAELFQAAAATYFRLVREGRTELRPKMAGYHDWTAYSLYQKGDLKGASAEYRVAIDLYQEAVKDTPGVVPDLARAMNNHGFILHELGDSEAAIHALRDSLAFVQRMVAVGRADCRDEVARIQGSLGEILAARGEKVEAVGLFREAASIREGLIQEGELDVLPGLIEVWSYGLEASDGDVQAMRGVVEPAVALLRHLAPRRNELSRQALEGVRTFLGAVQARSLLGDSAAVLARQYGQ